MLQIYSKMYSRKRAEERSKVMEMERGEEEEIVIVGGGICGLATALALHRKGIKSLVLERADTLRASGAAIGIYTNGWRALDQLGVGVKLRPTAIHLRAIRDFSLENNSHREISLGKEELRCLRRGDLIEALADSLPVNTIRFGCNMVSIKLDPLTSYPILQLHDGSVIKAKVVIGCDGANSITAKFLGLKPPQLFSLSGIRGLTNYPGGHGFNNDFVRIRKGRCILGRTPIDDKLVYWFVGRPWTPEDSNVSNNLELIRQSTPESIKDFPIEMVEMIKNSDLDSLSLVRLRYRSPWEILMGSFCRGTVVVAGDAMHVMGPFLGQGGSAGLEDAVVLARSLAKEMKMVDSDRDGQHGLMLEGVGAALDQFMKERRMRLVWLSMQTYLIGLLRQTSVLMKFVVLMLLLLLFGSNSLGHVQYDCGHL